MGIHKLQTQNNDAKYDEGTPIPIIPAHPNPSIMNIGRVQIAKERRW